VARPIVLGVVGDSGAGKTTLTRGLARVLGERSVSYVSGDDYHRYARSHRAELGITPLQPQANHLDIMSQHLGHLRRWEPILKPVYSHRTGTLEAPKHVRPGPFVLVEGLLNFHTEPLREAHDIRVFLAPPESMRRAWKLTRDCTRRGYTTHEVLEELDLRERDAAAYLRPQRAQADIVVAFRPGTRDRPEHLDAEVILRDTLRHPDLSPLIGPEGRGPTLVRREHESVLRIPGTTHPELAAELEEAVWQRMQYASHLRVQRLGEFMVGTELRHSESLALVQALLLYHLVSTRAAISAGIDPHTLHVPGVRGSDSALHA
jgi:phosphoribulokinase